MRFEDVHEVVELPGVGYAVKSASHPGYLAVVSDMDCSCPAGQHGARSCRHRQTVRVFCEDKARRMARPRAAMHSALLDN